MSVKEIAVSVGTYKIMQSDIAVMAGKLKVSHSFSLNEKAAILTAKYLHNPQTKLLDGEGGSSPPAGH